MKKSLSILLLYLLPVLQMTAQEIAPNNKVKQLFDSYYEERLKLFPLEATFNGDYRYNDLLPDDGSPAHLKKLADFYAKYLLAISKFEKSDLSFNDRLNCDILKYTLTMATEAMSFHPEYFPGTQFRSMGLTLGTWGSGKTIQPFASVKDYNDWLSRLNAFKGIVDTSILNYKKGLSLGYSLPAVLVEKMIPQMEKLAEPDSSKNIFYGPLRNFPSGFTLPQKETLRKEYHKTIVSSLLPSYLHLAKYLQNEYLPQARSTHGYDALPNGAQWYAFLVRQNTTTQKNPTEIYKFGIAEVERIKKEMALVQDKVNFKGTLAAFFDFLNNDPQFTPFKTAEEVLERFNTIYGKISPKLPEYFGILPKTPFEIRQTEAFRAATVAAQYMAGTADGKRPGIFYVPIVDPLTYTYPKMESLFMHEAIPGHHFQVSLQKEDASLPLFRKGLSVVAFAEGWALYAETLGKALGIYSDPYQEFGKLESEMHRAIRLVVDVSLHTGKMTREQAIKYMRDNMPITEQFATAEIERYMSLPGQALAYKIGQSKIEELRDSCSQQLGPKFSLKSFHDALLLGGSMPLNILEKSLDHWVEEIK